MSELEKIKEALEREARNGGTYFHDKEISGYISGHQCLHQDVLDLYAALEFYRRNAPELSRAETKEYYASYTENETLITRIYPAAEAIAKFKARLGVQ